MCDLDREHTPHDGHQKYDSKAEGGTQAVKSLRKCSQETTAFACAEGYRRLGYTIEVRQVARCTWIRLQLYQLD